MSVLVAMLLFAQQGAATAPMIMLERLTWEPSRSSDYYESISATVLNNLNAPLTETVLKVGFYREDGVKLAERFAFLDTVPPPEGHLHL
jgi:hypothetical protein